MLVEFEGKENLPILHFEDLCRVLQVEIEVKCLPFQNPNVHYIHNFIKYICEGLKKQMRHLLIIYCDDFYINIKLTFKNKYFNWLSFQ